MLSLFDEYVHGTIDRDVFLRNASPFASPGLDAGALLDALSPKFADNTRVPEGDPRITSEYVEFTSALRQRNRPRLPGEAVAPDG